MILLDANLVLYACWPSSKHHESARVWLEQRMRRNVQLLLSWNVIIAFLRIVSDTRVSRHAMSMQQAIRTVSYLLDQPNVSILAPGERHWEVFSKLLDHGQVRGALVSDAHLAALAMEHGARLATNDLDFRRFAGLETEYPLSPT